MDASLGAEARYEGLVIEDVQRACDVIRPVFEASQGDAGYVSLEVSPALADDEAGTVAAARRLRAAVARDNLLVKIPATAAGVRAIETLTGEGVSINVTLMFSLAHVEAVAGAYQRGLEKLAAAGGDIARVRSVASVFLSRWDSLIDKQLDEIGTPEALALRGKAGVALARQAYQRYLARFHGAGFAALAAKGGRPQSMLWASTGTKNAAYPDLMYVEPLIGPETVNTLPDATLAAFIDHGQVSGNTVAQVPMPPPPTSPRWPPSASTSTCSASACSRTAWPSSPPPSASCSNSRPEPYRPRHSGAMRIAPFFVHRAGPRWPAPAGAGILGGHHPKPQGDTHGTQSRSTRPSSSPARPSARPSRSAAISG
jgi:transaldolase